MSSPTPWEACGNVIRDADSIEVCTVALWCKSPSEVAQRIVTAVNAQAERRCETCAEWQGKDADRWGQCYSDAYQGACVYLLTKPDHSCAAWKDGAR